MNGFLDQALVALLLCGALFYAVLSLGPRQWKRSVLRTWRGWLGKAPTPDEVSSGCGGCGSCGTDQPKASVSETSIAVGKIGRRAR